MSDHAIPNVYGAANTTNEVGEFAICPLCDEVVKRKEMNAGLTFWAYFCKKHGEVNPIWTKR